jgi:murein DD-endopeptidase MepM/ murein hydrolase activator NlpD
MQPLENILKDIHDCKVIDNTISYSDYIPLDLSVHNTHFQNLQLKNAPEFEHYIDNYLLEKNAKVAYGGYNETRDLYKRSGIFNDLNTEERNIHLGLDLWIKAGTSVLAALDGTVHSFNYNTGLGDYGPTIILEHAIDEHLFYTLYGHLSLDSLKNIAVGDFFAKGQLLATLGEAAVNGDYAPHLHFQIIKNIQEMHGDYPGVCSKKDLDFYLENCPDPNLLLKI